MAVKDALVFNTGSNSFQTVQSGDTVRIQEIVVIYYLYRILLVHPRFLWGHLLLL